MLAYRHAFHAGNHADVFKHVVLVALLRHLNLKDKGWRFVDTHAGAGGYALGGRYARQGHEAATGVQRLWPQRGQPGVPAVVADWLEQVALFNPDGRLTQVPGSPALALQLRRPQDQLRLAELHPTDHKILAAFAGHAKGVEVGFSDGFALLKSQLPPPTRRALVLIDPSYELKADYPKTLAALREALQRFAEAIVMVWMPQLQLLEAAQLPRRLEASCDGVAKKGWLLARLTVCGADARGFGMVGSQVFVANPPHTLAPALREALPWLAERLGQDAHAGWEVRGRSG